MSTINWYNPVVKQATLTNTDTTATKLFDLPGDSKIVELTVQTAAAAALGTCDIGITGDTDRYIDDLDVSAQGQARGSILVDEWLAAATVIYGLIAFGGVAAGGPFVVTCMYINRKSTRLT